MSYAIDAESLTKLAGELQYEPREPATSQAILRYALVMLENAELASLTVRARQRSYKTVGSTDRLADVLDEAQYAHGEGPCVATADGHGILTSSDLSADTQWPTWAPIAVQHGVRSVLSVRLDSKGQPFGALNLYATRAGAFADRSDVELAALYAVHAANALSAARQVTGLETALDSRHDIGLAQGILMERYALGIDQSFAFLRRVSQMLNRKLRDVAREIIETGEVPTVPADTTTHNPAGADEPAG